MTGIEQIRPGRAALSVWAKAAASPAVSLGFLAVACCLQPGCTTDYASSDPAFPGDFQARHPIALASAPTRMDVYPIVGALDARTVANLRVFAQRYREFGSGEVVILTPGRRDFDARAVGEIRRILASAGLRGRVAIGSYAPSDPNGAAPIQVAFMGLKAEVRTPCGLWPQDLASGSSVEGWKNEPYYNFGCATQSVIAAQVDDPRDFVQPRALGPSDVAMRTRAIEDVRNGQDPGTDWKTKLNPIGSVGGGGGQ
ncbi:MAG TPA: CpaD family pilus assembly protein [Roseiarcus sp.]|jgi:pilus assembly protein CpaD|nr:CpaD family pilus assembly protein [Roseiarcus sp.]